VYRTSLQLQIDDYINSTSIKQLGGKYLKKTIRDLMQNSLYINSNNLGLK